jgi:MRG-binding protein
MPPRKRAKASAASTPHTDAQPKTPQESSAAHEQSPLQDDWADEQETQLFKSMMKWKPTGMHKHFRMVSIHADMRSHGFAADDAPHTRIPGIWRKLHQLYDLRALDERENAYAFDNEPDPTDPSDANTVPEFELPEDEFGNMVWERRFHGPESVASSSPPMIPVEEDKALFVPYIGLLKDLPDGVLSQKAESVAEATPTPKKAKTTRASKAAAAAATTTTKSGKAAKGQAAVKNSKTQSAGSESAENEDDDDNDEEESSVESEEDPAPSTRRTNRSTGKARPAPKRTRKR